MTEEIKKTEDVSIAEELVEEVAAQTAVKSEAASLADKSETEAKKKKKKLRKQIAKGQAHIQCTYNNTMVAISDLSGAILGWSSSGLLGFKGAKKATPYAATQVVGDVAEKVKKYGIQELDIYVKGVGSGREASIRALANRGYELGSIKDLTPIPHNGCRPRKPRRV